MPESSKSATAEDSREKKEREQAEKARKKQAEQEAKDYEAQMRREDPVGTDIVEKAGRSSQNARRGNNK